jgi:hypothetical protein
LTYILILLSIKNDFRKIWVVNVLTICKELNGNTNEPHSTYWHVRVRLLKPQGNAFSCIEFDLTWRELYNDILEPFCKLERFKCEGRLVKSFDIDFITYFKTTKKKSDFLGCIKEKEKTRKIRNKADQFETMADHIGDRNKIEVISAQYDLTLSIKKRVSLVWVPAIKKHIATVIVSILVPITVALLLALLGLK